MAGADQGVRRLVLQAVLDLLRPVAADEVHGQRDTQLRVVAQPQPAAGAVPAEGPAVEAGFERCVSDAIGAAGDGDFDIIDEAFTGAIEEDFDGGSCVAAVIQNAGDLDGGPSGF